METWEYVANYMGKWYMVFVVFIGDLLGVLAGMTFAWPSPALVKLHEDDNPLGKHITDDEETLINTLFSIGGAAGPIILMFASRIMGRKSIMSVIIILFSSSFFILSFSKTITLYYVCRIIQGSAVALVFGIMILYIGELSSVKMRGIYVSSVTSAILTGCLLSYCIGPYVSLLTFNLIIAISALIYLPLFHFTCPETLYHTMKVHGVSPTLKILEKIRRKNNHFQELELIRRSIEDDTEGTFLDLLRSRAAKKALAMSIFLLLLQQFSGINVILIYRQSIFEDAHVELEPAVSAIIVSGLQVLTCFITPVASNYIDRKPLLIFSLIPVAISNVLIGLYFQIPFFNELKLLPLVSLILYVISYNCGVGSLPWVYLGELFPVKVSSIGTSVCNVIYWLSLFVVTLIYEKVAEGITFFIFGGICFVSIFIVQIFLIETRGKSFQEIQNCLE